MNSQKERLTWNLPCPASFCSISSHWMLLLLEIGRRVRVKRRPKESEGEQSGLSSVEGAVFALFGLMMAFTFSGAASRLAENGC